MSKDVVFCDLDGTIVNSEKVRIKTYFQTFEFLGIKTIKHPSYDDLIGNSEITNIYKIKPDLNESQLGKILRVRKDFLNKINLEKIKPKTQVIEEVSSFKYVVIVTNSSLDYAKRILKRYMPRFQEIVTPSLSLSPKPQADMYQYAFKKYALDSKRIVFEDSEPGIISAKLAGADIINKVINENFFRINFN